MSRVFATFTDPDGNFVKDFQTAGFDARLFELYLHAYFSCTGFGLDRTHDRPDYLVSRRSLSVAVEATTANPSQSGALAQNATPIADLDTPQEVAEYAMGELALRMSGPLLAKLNKKYWELDHVKGKPLVLAIEAFHDKDAQQFTDSALTSYLYGLHAQPSMSEDGVLTVDANAVADHRKAGKVVASGFFTQPLAEHVSAVLFTNAGTHAKFTRMGYQAGVGNDILHIVRMGTAFDSEPSAMLPTYFRYNLDAPPRVEPWGEGLVVVHNPNALHPLPDAFFPCAVDTRLEDGRFVSLHRAWHPFSSKTIIGHDPHKVRRTMPLPMAPVEIGAITKDEFHNLVPVHPVAARLYLEEAWLADDTGSFLGVVVSNKDDGEWGYSVFARDERFQFWPIETNMSQSSREEAGRAAQHFIEKVLLLPQRVFPR